MAYKEDRLTNIIWWKVGPWLGRKKKQLCYNFRPYCQRFRFVKTRATRVDASYNLCARFICMSFVNLFPWLRYNVEKNFCCVGISSILVFILVSTNMSITKKQNQYILASRFANNEFNTLLYWINPLCFHFYYFLFICVSIECIYKVGFKASKDSVLYVR